MRKINKGFLKRLIPMLLLMTIIIPTLAPTVVFAAPSTTTEEAGFFEKSLSKAVRGFGKGLETVFLSDPDAKLDAVVYNQKSTQDYGLTLLKGGDLAKFFFEFYMLFQYVAGAMFAPIVIWISIYFTRASHDAQKKAELKDRLQRVIITIVLLTSMPSIIDMFLVVNGAFVDIFGSVAMNILSNKSIDPANGLLMEQFYNTAKSSGRLAENVVYLMSVFLNIWFVIYYFIRDLTIAYLFLFYPPLAALFPLQKGMVMDWYKQMASNIFTQCVHSILLTIAIGVAFIPVSGNLLFSMVAMGMVIPVTSTLKRKLGIEGDVGAAKSMAGIGIMMEAYHLGKGVLGNVKQGVGNIAEGRREMKQIDSQIQTHEKGLATDGKSDLSQSLQSTNNSGPSLDELKGMKRQARKKMYQGVGRLSGATTLGALTATGASVFGGRAATLAFGGGFAAGGGAGDLAGAGVGNVSARVEAEMDYMKDRSDVKAEHDIYGNEYAENVMFGLDDEMLDGTQYQTRERIARKAQKKYNLMGKPDVAQRQYNKITPKRYSQSDIEKMGDVKMYQSENVSALYKKNENGTYDVLSTFEGNPTLKGKDPITSSVSFNDGGFELSNDEYNDINEAAQNKALDIAGSSNIPLYNKVYNEEFSKMKQDKQEQMKLLRAKTGLGNMVLGQAEIFKGIMPSFNPEEGINLSSISEKNLVDISSSVMNIQGEGQNFEDGVGIMTTTSNGTSIFRVDPQTDKMQLVGTAVGDSSLSNGQVMQTGVKFQDGKVLADQVRHQVENSLRTSVGEQPMINYDMAHVPQQISSNAQAEDVIEITVTEENGQAYQNFVNVSQNQFMGREPISPDIAQAQMNTTTRVIVNKQGGWQQIGNPEAMNTNNLHNIVHSQSSVPYEVQQTYELGHKKTQIMNAINEMRNAYEMPNVDINNEVTGAML